MDNEKRREDVKQAVRLLAEPFFEQGDASVWVSTCCERVFVGEVAPTKCRRCGKAAQAKEARSVEEAVSIVS